MAVRPALAAAAIAIVGVVGAVTLVDGIDDALRDPARSGRSWQLEADPNSEKQLRTAAQVPGISAVALASRAATTVSSQDVPFYALEQVKGAINFVVLHGRAPEGNDEIMLGARSAKVLHAGLGSEVRADSGGPKLHVVGIGLLIQTPHTTFDEGGLVTMPTLDAVSHSTLDGRVGFLLIDTPKAEGRARADRPATDRPRRRAARTGDRRDQPGQRPRPPATCSPGSWSCSASARSAMR